ncbi:hypothetical protein KKC94_01045 [Patescibacteria group bacterium]|nr:hypothetical protein [Patescibacteria group bacterium]
MLETLGRIALEYEKGEMPSASPEVAKECERIKDKIDAVLEETEFFHGTGRFAYVPNGQSKYDGIEGDQVQDVFERLLKQGLKPHDDLFSDVFTGDESRKTVSMTNARMYARVYSDLYMDEQDDPLEYRYGSKAFWWLFFCARMGFHVALSPETHIRILKYNLWERWSREKLAADMKRYQKATQWQRTFRNDDRYKSGLGYKDNFMHLMCEAGSTISDNYGMIVGVRAGAVSPVFIKQGHIRCFEIRTDETVSPSDWTYVEAPESKVDEVKDALSEAGLNDLPVFSMEVMEYYHAQEPFDELTKKHVAAKYPKWLMAK